MLDDAAPQLPAPSDDRPPAAPVTTPASACWLLQRPCALTPRQLLASYAVLVAASGAVALVCGLLGWWVVVAYYALEVLAAGALYLLYMVHALDGERITLAPGGLLTVELARGLHQRSVVMNPVWTRLERCSQGQRDTLWLCCRQTRVEVASQLGPLHKQRLERELRRALQARQQGRSWRDNPYRPPPSRQQDPSDPASACY